MFFGAPRAASRRPAAAAASGCGCHGHGPLRRVLSDDMPIQLGHDCRGVRSRTLFFSCSARLSPGIIGRNPRRVSPAIKSRVHANAGVLDAIIDGEGKASRKHLMVAKLTGVYAGESMQGLDVRQEAFEEMLADAQTLALVEADAVQKVLLLPREGFPASLHGLPQSIAYLLEIAVPAFFPPGAAVLAPQALRHARQGKWACSPACGTDRPTTFPSWKACRHGPFDQAAERCPFASLPERTSTAKIRWIISLRDSDDNDTRYSPFGTLGVLQKLFTPLANSFWQPQSRYRKLNRHLLVTGCP